MFKTENEFYPTPEFLIDIMFQELDLNKIKTVLEPNAGKGDIIDKLIVKAKNNMSYGYRNSIDLDIDAVEISEDLRHILKGKGYRVIHDDFLTLNTFKKYDLIAMNPPFSQGERHFLKALDMQQNGGSIICILNAETLRNPYSNFRKDLVKKLIDYNAQIDYIKDAFTSAERKTDVEIALIKVKIPKKKNSSNLVENLKKSIEKEKYDINDPYYLASNEFIQNIVEQYNFEVRAGLELIKEYKAMQPYILKEFSKDKKESNPIIKLEIDSYSNNKLRENEFIKCVRLKYWKALFSSKEFTEMLTSNLQSQYHQKIHELADYDFTLYNIYQIKIDISKSMISSVEETIISLFNEFSVKHYWDKDSVSGNIHYFNGWATNKSWKIGKKVIIPLSAYSTWSNDLDIDYRVRNKLADIEKVFNYLDGGLSEPIDLGKTLEEAMKNLQSRKIKLKYFTISFFKKGTCHIEFDNLDLLKKFNLFGSQRMNWLPPTYGKKDYDSMTEEEKAVIDSFEGKESYKETMKRKNYFICENNKLLQIACVA